MSNHVDTICNGLECLELLHLFLPPPARHAPNLRSALFSCSTPILFYLIPPLPFHSIFLSYCLTLVFSTIFALAPLTRRCSQMLPPPQPLHWLLWRWCSQRPLPPQSLHWPFCRWCSQRPLPPQSLHLLLRHWCSQTLRGFLAAAGGGARAAIRPDTLSGFTSRSSCLRRFPCGPLGACASSILFVPAAAASGPSV